MPLNQPLAHLAVAALEPDTQNSYFANRLVEDLSQPVRVMSTPSLVFEETDGGNKVGPARWPVRSAAPRHATPIRDGVACLAPHHCPEMAQHMGPAIPMPNTFLPGTGQQACGRL